MTKSIRRWLVLARQNIQRNDILIAVVTAALVVGFGVWLGWYNNKIIPQAGPTYRYISANPLSFLSNWDGPDYLYIAGHGYNRVANAGFFPLYPLLIRGLYYLVRSYLMSALLVSWASLVGVVYFFIKVVKKLGILKENESPLLAVALLVLFPTAVFFIASYSESLFALLSLASIYFALSRRYVWAGGFVALASLTHIDGIFVLALDALILYEDKLPLKKIGAYLALGLSGLAAYMVYLKVRFNNALAFLTEQKKVHGWLGAHYFQLLRSTDYFNALFCLLLIIAAVYFWGKRKSLSVYALLFLLIPLAGGQWGGFNRYVLMAFPIPFMLYAVLKDRRQWYVLIIVLSAVLWTYTLLQYAAGYIGS